MSGKENIFSAVGAGEPANDDAELKVLAERLPPLLAVIAGMVDLTGFFMLGNIFTAHVTGNLVLAAAAVVRGGPLNSWQAFAIPVFMVAVALTWLIARTSNRHGTRLARLLLFVQFALLMAVLVFCVVTRPSGNPHGPMAGIAAMIAVAAMGCQFALLRLAMPRVVSTAVMTGNLTNAVLSLLDVAAKDQSLPAADSARLRSSLKLLGGFLLGCVLAAGAIFLLSDWAWSLPVALSALAIALR